MKKYQSEFFKWQEEYGELKFKEGMKKGREKGREEIIKEFLKSMTPTEIAEKSNIPLSKIQKIAEQKTNQ